MELQNIEQQVWIARNISLIKDVQEIIVKYIEGSFPLYRIWVDNLYDNYIATLEKDSNYNYHKEDIVNKIIQIFLIHYGINIGALIENIKNARNLKKGDFKTRDCKILCLFKINKNATKDVLRMLGSLNLSVKLPHNSSYAEDCQLFIRNGKLTKPYSTAGLYNSPYSHAILFKEITKLWLPYRSQIFKEIDDIKEPLLCNFLAIGVGGTSMLKQIMKTFKNRSDTDTNTDRDIYEVDIIRGQSFIDFILLKFFMKYENELQREEFENLMLNLMKNFNLNERNYGKRNESLPIFDILKHTDYEDRLVGWSTNFSYQILERMDLTILNNKEKTKLRWYFTEFNLVITENQSLSKIDELWEMD